MAAEEEEEEWEGVVGVFRFDFDFILIAPNLDLVHLLAISYHSPVS